MPFMAESAISLRVQQHGYARPRLAAYSRLARKLRSAGSGKWQVRRYAGECIQRTQDIVCGTRNRARHIEIFHAHQPGAVVFFCFEVTADRCNEGTEMEGAGGGGGETPPVALNQTAATSSSSNSSTTLPSFTSTVTLPPFASLPNSSSSASTERMVSWMRRAIGRAPISGSKPCSAR